MDMKGTTVSDDLNSDLNRVAGDMPSETTESKSFLTEAESRASYRRCTWRGGCYYCQGADGRWRLIHCVG